MLQRLKKELLQANFKLLEQRNCRCVVLTIKDEFGKALVECPQNTLKDNGFILSNDARIVWAFSFAKDEVFHGVLLKEKQEASVPLPLSLPSVPLSFSVLENLDFIISQQSPNLLLRTLQSKTNLPL